MHMDLLRYQTQYFLAQLCVESIYMYAGLTRYHIQRP